MSYFFMFDKLFSGESLSKRSFKHVKENDNEILVVNCAGFEKEDITIEIKNDFYNDYLYINAKPKEEIKNYVDELNLRFQIYADLISEINYEVKNGLLYITIIKKDNKSKIKINAK